MPSVSPLPPEPPPQPPLICLSYPFAAAVIALLLIPNCRRRHPFTHSSGDGRAALLLVPVRRSTARSRPVSACHASIIFLNPSWAETLGKVGGRGRRFVLGQVDGTSSPAVRTADRSDVVASGLYPTEPSPTSPVPIPHCSITVASPVGQTSRGIEPPLPLIMNFISSVHIVLCNIVEFVETMQLLMFRETPNKIQSHACKSDYVHQNHFSLQTLMYAPNSTIR